MVVEVGVKVRCLSRWFQNSTSHLGESSHSVSPWCAPWCITSVVDQVFQSFLACYGRPPNSLVCSYFDEWSNVRLPNSYPLHTPNHRRTVPKSVHPKTCTNPVFFRRPGHPICSAGGFQQRFGPETARPFRRRDRFVVLSLRRRFRRKLGGT